MRRLLLLLTLCLALPLQAADEFREITWNALLPKGWDPAKEFRALNLDQLEDADPRAMEALEKMKVLWDTAPTEASLAGARIRVPGFFVPLEVKGSKVSEFLLVPYFGACIHSPPPPANQIIHVTSKKPIATMETMEAVFVSGTLSLQHANTPWGSAGYRLELDRMELYSPPPRETRRN